MDHKFSKHEYFISCTVTLFYVGILAASYFDISVCPYTHNSAAAGVVPGARQAEGTAASSSCGTAASSADENEAMRSLLAAIRQPNGLSCHMIDIVIWTYIVGLVIFMGHKFITYRMQGMHYFFLDYCYFHSAALVVFLLWRLVDIRWSEQPLISWASHLPPFLQHARNATRMATTAEAPAFDRDGGAFQHPFLTSGGKGTRALTSRAVVSAAKRTAVGGFPDGLYYPISVDLLTTSFVTSHMTETEVLSSFVVFFTLLAGSFGPILGAIFMWRNALLFHSFDRMSSCYLHLMPATIQAMLLHRLFTSAKRELKSFSPAELFNRANKLATRFHEPLENFLPKAAAAVLSLDNDANSHGATKQERFARYAEAHPIEAFCGEGTLCYDLSHAVTFVGLLKLHFYMFLAWELVYNVFSEVRRRQREHKVRKARLRQLAKERKQFMQATGCSEEEADLLRPPVSLSEGLLGDPYKRVTAYTWMMEHPPGGRQGPLYRFVTCLGTGRLPTTILFQVTQWLLHTVFFTCCYPVLYLSFHCLFSAVPLLLYVMLFILITVYNAAKMNQKWIASLQRLAAAGLVNNEQGQNVRAAAPVTTSTEQAVAAGRPPDSASTPPLTHEPTGGKKSQ